MLEYREFKLLEGFEVFPGSLNFTNSNDCILHHPLFDLLKIVYVAMILSQTPKHLQTL